MVLKISVLQLKLTIQINVWIGYAQTCLFDSRCIRGNKMLVSLRGVRIDGV